VTSAIRSEALEMLDELAEFPRMSGSGQLLAHLGFLGEDRTARTLRDIEDEQLLSVFNHHSDELKSRKDIAQLGPARAG